MKKITILLLIILSSFSARANLITNAEFNVNVSGWTCETGSNCGIQSAYPDTAYIFNNSSVGSLYQTLATESGQLYDFSFDWFTNGDNNIGGFSIDGFHTEFDTGPSDLTPKTFFGSFIATSSLTEFGLLAYTGSGYGTLQYDNISVVAAPQAVPEPVSILLLGIGLAGIGFSRRKKTV